MSLRSFSIIALLLVAFGCSGKTDDGKQQVTGTVSWNGESITKGQITLFSSNGAADSADIKNGSFAIRTTPGSKVVSVTGLKDVGTPQATARIPNPTPVFFQFLPKSANSESKTKQEITADTKSFDVKLEGKELVMPRDYVERNSGN